MLNLSTPHRVARALVAAALLCGLLAAVSPIAAQQPQAASVLIPADKPYKIVDHWKVGGDGGWDYLLADPPVHRLYLTRGARVEVLDTQTGKSVGTIAGLHGTHGIALDDAGLALHPPTRADLSRTALREDGSVAIR